MTSTLHEIIGRLTEERDGARAAFAAEHHAHAATVEALRSIAAGTLDADAVIVDPVLPRWRLRQSLDDDTFMEGRDSIGRPKMMSGQ